MNSIRSGDPGICALVSRSSAPFSPIRSSNGIVPNIPICGWKCSTSRYTRIALGVRDRHTHARADDVAVGRRIRLGNRLGCSSSTKWPSGSVTMTPRASVVLAEGDRLTAGRDHRHAGLLERRERRVDVAHQQDQRHAAGILRLRANRFRSSPSAPPSPRRRWIRESAPSRSATVRWACRTSRAAPDRR